MKFSIITCTYNSAGFLQKNIDSVKRQTLGDFEHIFVDGNSKDDTVALIKKYQSEFPDKVKLFSAEPKGISNAMNIGTKNASGDYLIHLNSDDSLYDGKVLLDVREFLKDNDYDWVYGKINVVDESGIQLGLFPERKIWQNSNKDKLGRYLLKFYNYIPHQSVFIKKEMFDKFGYFDESLSSAMDPDMWLRICNNTKWSFCGIVVSNYGLRKESETASVANREKNNKNYEQVLKRYLNPAEYCLARFIRFLLELKNKNYR